MLQCDRCGKSRPTAFALGDVTVCATCAVRDRALLQRALATSMVVGSVLLVINHGDTLLSGNWPPALVWKLPLTYAVPFAVCMWGALGGARR